jgi:hypothetical protein
VSQNDDPVPPGLLLSLDEVFRVLEALEDEPMSLLDFETSWRLSSDSSTLGLDWTKEA